MTPPAAARRERELARLPAELAVERLDNGLTVCLAPLARAPVVATALWYRAGARHEPPRRAGLAHFLEHLMFKGSGGYPAGEIDRLTQALGGTNNAFTSHDATVYHFAFAGEHWAEALRIEADRMTGLEIDPSEVENERRVILEELAMSEEQPWEALELAVAAELFGGHPYGRPVLGTRASLAEIAAADLERFYRARYGPDNAVLAVAGNLGDGALAEIRERLGAKAPVRARPHPPRPARFEKRLRRLERRRGEVSRLLVCAPCPPADDPVYAPLRLLLTVLGGGRASRLHDLLVESRQLCVAISTEIAETVEPGAWSVSAELVPGASESEVEEIVLGELARLHREPPRREEVERARQLLLSDWVFSLETAEPLAMACGLAVALFDPGYQERHIGRVLAAGAAELEAAAACLDVERGGVLGWSRGPAPAAPRSAGR